ncbi:MAG: hypothetical protein FJ104_14860, partial [Deltaproteobacteria bacterium]|nr:hypothetical protein [Deltaproteobacteria bacterium]
SEPCLFLDDAHILGARKLSRRLHPLQKRNDPLSFPLPESLMESCQVVSIVPAPDGRSFLVYASGEHRNKILYAVFRTSDGVTFEPVVLDQVPSERVWDGVPAGSRPEHNNVLLFDRVHGSRFPPYYAAFFRVPGDDPFPYRALAINKSPRPRKAVVLRSKDGLDWEPSPGQIPHVVTFESNAPTYDPFRNRYLCYLRAWDPPLKPVAGWRKVLLTEGITEAGVLRWTPDELVLAANEADGAAADIYYMQVFGYAAGYVGIPVLYHRASSLDPEKSGRFYGELATSSDARTWRRVAQGQPLLAPGAPGAWDYGLVGPSAGPVVIDGQLVFYYWGRRQTHDEPLPPDVRTQAGAATLRLDGFVSMDAGPEEGTLLTTPLWPAGKHLYVNADARGGEIRVEVLQDYTYVELKQFDRPESLRGLFRKESCTPITSDAVAHRVEWKHGENFADSFPAGWNQPRGDLGKMRDFSRRAIALKFTMRNARLYSFWFADGPAPAAVGRIVPAERRAAKR